MQYCASGYLRTEINLKTSALGQKQTCAAQKGMSALPPIATAKADIYNAMPI